MRSMCDFHAPASAVGAGPSSAPALPKLSFGRRRRFDRDGCVRALIPALPGFGVGRGVPRVPSFIPGARMTRVLALVVRAVATCSLPHDHTAKQHPRVRHAYRPGRLVSAFVALGWGRCG
jgi:hypothetical protein